MKTKDMALHGHIATALSNLDVVRYGFVGLVLKVATCFAKTLKQSVNHHSRSRYHTRPSRASHIRHGTRDRQKHPHDSECHGHRTLACNRLRELPSQAPERLRRPCSCLGCLHDPVDDGNTLHLIMIPKSEIGDRV